MVLKIEYKFNHVIDTLAYNNKLDTTDKDVVEFMTLNSREAKLYGTLDFDD